MTTAPSEVTTANKVAVCVVVLGARSIKVTSPSGKSLEVDHQRLKEANPNMHRLLSRGEPGVAVNVSMTYAQMGLLKSCEFTPAGVTAQQTVDTIAERTVNRAKASGASKEEQDLNRMVKVADKLSKPLVLLTYDIPDRLGKECPNPSNILWRYGFRLNFSCWILPEESMNLPALRGLLTLWGGYPLGTLPPLKGQEEGGEGTGVEPHVIPQNEKQTKQLREIALEKLRREIIKTHTSLINRMGDASDRLTAAEKALDEQPEDVEVTPTDRDKPANLYRSSAYSAIKDAREDLEACISCARAFDESGKVADLLSWLRKAIESETASYRLHRYYRPARNGMV